MRFLYIVLLLMSTTANAATTGSIVLTGIIPAFTSIQVTSQSGFNSLDLTLPGVDKLVATVREINNTGTGYVVTMSSANAGKLTRVTGEQVTYTAKYNNVAAPLTLAPVQVTNAPGSSSVVNVLKNLTVSYPAQLPENTRQGNYSDTLTFTITAN